MNTFQVHQGVSRQFRACVCTWVCSYRGGRILWYGGRGRGDDAETHRRLFVRTYRAGCRMQHVASMAGDVVWRKYGAHC